MAACVGLCAVLLVACDPAPEPTPSPDPATVQTRIAATLAGIPTAALLTPRPPLPTPPARIEPAQTSASPPVAPAPPPITGPAQRYRMLPTREYTVQAGDTLSTIAVAFDTSMAAIQILNDMSDSRVVKIGQVLKIPIGKVDAEENPLWFVYVVPAGTTLSEIAARFRVRLDDLLRVNEIAQPAQVRAGQRLIIPVRAGADNASQDAP